MLGFWVTGHPLDRYADKVAELATTTAATWKASQGRGSGAVRRADGHHAQAQPRRASRGRR
jgi:hypothetical protein